VVDECVVVVVVDDDDVVVVVIVCKEGCLVEATVAYQ
jgi:hypothetical protein